MGHEPVAIARTRKQRCETCDIDLHDRTRLRVDEVEQQHDYWKENGQIRESSLHLNARVRMLTQQIDQ